MKHKYISMQTIVTQTTLTDEHDLMEMDKPIGSLPKNALSMMVFLIVALEAFTSSTKLGTHSHFMLPMGVRHVSTGSLYISDFL
jgi:hypothetical protein